jgi:hydroxyethylthiazole kinase-like uncharacterized protein yjeF
MRLSAKHSLNRESPIARSLDRFITPAAVRRMIPPRPLASHKGSNGHVLIVAGSRGMPGAAILACLGALKSGAGLVTLATTDNVKAAAARRLPEVMTIPLSGIRSYVRRRTITTLAAGPGLSVSPAVRRVVKSLLGLELPLVLDADGLNNLTARELMDPRQRRSGMTSVLITPHPGELSRLLKVPMSKIQAHRSLMAQETARRLNVICVLKGHHTVVSDGKRIVINSTGNPAMATGGMGDVLTGIIAGLLAQGLTLFDAACAGVYLHGLAGDLARVSDRGLLATELAAHIPQALKKIGIK